MNTKEMLVQLLTSQESTEETIKALTQEMASRTAKFNQLVRAVDNLCKRLKDDEAESS